uniref:CSON001413 protein n=1 Tax=Culicoides sonorensis TaxID=179676 RepID=A0A336LVR7_CULSO
MMRFNEAKMNRKFGTKSSNTVVGSKKSKMVQGIDLIVVDVAFLTYNPSRDIHNPLVKLDSTCNAGLFELKKHREMKRKQKYEMGLDAYKHYKWYNSCLKIECSRTDNATNTKLKILHWHIESGNIEAFKMQGVTYKAVSIIISPTVEYWYCANQGPNALHTFGSRLRGVAGNEPTTQNETCEIWLEPLMDHKMGKKCPGDESCKKNNCLECKKELKSQKKDVKNPKSFIDNKLSKENDENDFGETSSVLKAIDLLNQKKSILRNGIKAVPKVQNSKRNALKPIFEEHN